MSKIDHFPTKPMTQQRLDLGEPGGVQQMLAQLKHDQRELRWEAKAASKHLWKLQGLVEQTEAKITEVMLALEMENRHRT